MSVLSGQGVVVRFAEFELDLRSGELRVNGTSARLQPQPAKILALLVRRSGETVTRDEIIREVWGSDTFVDYDGGLNFAIRQIRQTLGDNAERPLYIETIPKRGYRFVGRVDGHPLDSVREFSVPASEESENSPRPSRAWRRHAFKAAAVLLAVLGLLGVPRARYWVLGGSTTKAVQSLAVLPFENLSGDSSKDYFADGFTDELTTDLAEQTRIRVVSRSSVERYKGSRKPLMEMARELGVDAIVEGSVSISEQRVRITAQLIEAASDRHLWAHSYERDRKDLFLIQSEVAATISGFVRANTGPSKSSIAHVPFRPRFNAATYELMLECGKLRNMATEEGVGHAIQCYQHILTLDPNNADAYSGLALAYLAVDPPKARDPAIKAIELDPSLPEPHCALAAYRLFARDLEGANTEFDRALALNPSYAFAHVSHGDALLAAGRTAPAMAEARTARELDPFSASIALYGGRIFFMARQYDEAIKELMAALDLDPQKGQAHYWLGYSYEQKGMYKEAIAEYEKVEHDFPQGLLLAAIGRSFLRGGEFKKAAVVRRKIEHFPGDGVWPPYDAALFYAVLGDNDHAFESLEKELKNGPGWLLFLKVDPRLTPLRSDPRFADLVKRAGLPQ